MGQYKDLINKVLFTLSILFFYKLCTYFPLPGIDLLVIQNFFEEQKNTMFGMANLFSGGAIERMSFVAIGVMPYITAAILMELFAHFDKNLGALKKEKDGMIEFIQKTRYLTVIIATFQAIGVTYGVSQMGENVINIDVVQFMSFAVPMMVLGTMLLMWLGEQITAYGIGNGISLIIFTAIVSSIPGGLVNTLGLVDNGTLNFIVLLVILAIIVITMIFIIFIEKAERRLPLQYTSSEMKGNFLPIKLNLTNVIPAIFAGALISIPATFGVFFKDVSYLNFFNDLFAPGSWTYHFITFILIFFFALLYSKISFKVKDVSANLNNSGAFIPGIRPGEHTEEFLSKIVKRISVFSGIYLGFIATIPWIVMQQLGAPFYFGGIVTLVVIQVVFDFVSKLSNELKTIKSKENEENTFF